MNILVKLIKPLYLSIKGFTQRFVGVTTLAEIMHSQNHKFDQINLRLQQLESLKNLENLVRHTVLTSTDSFAEQALVASHNGALPQFTDFLTQSDFAQKTSIVKDYFIPEHILNLIQGKKVAIVGNPISNYDDHTIIPADQFYNDLRTSKGCPALKQVKAETYDYLIVTNEFLSSLTTITPSVMSTLSHSIREGLILYLSYSNQRQFIHFSDDGVLSFSIKKIAQLPYHFFNYITFHSTKFDETTTTTTPTLTKAICSKFTDSISTDLDNAIQTTNFVVLSRN